MSTALKIDIGEAQIQNAIAVALVESFSDERKDRLVTDIVRAHLNQKENSYDRETLLSKRVGGMIREVAGEEVTKLVQAMRPRIAAVISAKLGPSFQDGVISSLEDALEKIVLSNIKLRAEVTDLD